MDFFEGEIMVRRVGNFATVLFGSLLWMGMAPATSLAQGGSALGAVSIENDVSLGGESASSGQIVFDGDAIVTRGDASGATVELVDGGNVTIFGNSEVQLGIGQIVYGAIGGGCFAGLVNPVDIVVNGQVVATGATSGGIFNGTYFASCSQAVSALSAAGGGMSAIVKASIVTTGSIVGYEAVVDDDPTHGD